MDNLQINISNACNLRCLFCYAHSPFLLRKKRPAFFDPALFKRTTDEAVSLGVKVLTISGDGEPTLHPRFASFAAYARKKMSCVKLLTNGTFDEGLREAVSVFDRVIVNLSAVDQGTYQGIHKPKRPADSFEKVVANIKYLLRVARRQRRDFLSVRFMLNKKNFSWIEDYLGLCSSLGIEDVRFKVFKSRPGTEALLFSRKHDLSKLLSAVRGADGSKCPIAGKEVFVDVNGDVYPCEENRGFLLGNLKARGLKELSASEQMRRFKRLSSRLDLRKKIWKECRGCPYGCHEL